MLQRARDAAAGLDTAGFVSGDRGSPLGNLDRSLWKAAKQLAEHRIHFEPGVSEELAATAVWGSQQVNLFPGAKHDGVFAMWYGKGPGADRSVDVFKHANASGTSRHGGVLAVVGDDHGAKSSSLPHQSDHIFAASMIPVLNPAGVQEFLDLGLHGWAMSRFSGCWVGMRAIADTVETSAGIVVDPHRIETRLPADFEMPPGGLSIRWPDPPLEQEYRLQRWKVYAAMAYARANGLNRVVLDSPRARFGIITTDKSFLDVLQAFDALGIDEALAAGTTRAVINSDFSVTSDFVRSFAAQARGGDVAAVRDPQFPLGAIEEQIAEAAGPGRAEFVAATRLATALLGDSLATNLFMVGHACQKGLLPVSAASILRAIEMNGAAVEMNRDAFLWGRRAALDLAAVERVASPPEALPDHRRLSLDLDERVARRVAELTVYQDARYARRYADRVRQVREAELVRAPGCTGLAEAVARGHYKLLATKDEYEVARLHTETGFLERLGQTFEGDTRFVFHLAPPLWARLDPATGEPRKHAFGPWVLHAFRVLARLRRLRGSALDPFRFTQDRKLDRRLLAEYERLLDELIGSLHPGNHALAMELASLPDQIRGYGHIRRRHAEHAKSREARLLEAFRRRDERPGTDGERVPEAPVLMRG
ncbi:hypothetical protein QMO56_13655 [Roseomonas sp. E05]|uniref:DUF6537 domain-containing protein n=1 Tax=Roseomonas sp. E05 TaxID=3046310 RepID=UPI0024BBB628|nr:DUF6537 domain-containing protein [Roseomonas sp. E05]MDJ0389163.1 hypothetical protein [Roseomonas sp. E05]